MTWVRKTLSLYIQRDIGENHYLEYKDTVQFIVNMPKYWISSLQIF